MTIRAATNDDKDGLIALHAEAFPEGEGALVGRLAVDLLAEKSKPVTVSLVMDDDGRIIGHIALSPLHIKGPHKPKAYILAPLAVATDRQKQGVGSALIAHGRQMLEQGDSDFLLVYGDPKYYGRFGFEAELARAFAPPFPLKHPFGWLAVALGDVVLTEERYPFECVASLNKAAYW